jgi:hypothetical protein
MINSMNATESKSLADLTLRDDEEAVMAHFLTGAPLDPEVARRVNERAQRIRAEIFRQHGLVDIAVPAIRELRGELPE